MHPLIGKDLSAKRIEGKWTTNPTLPAAKLVAHVERPGHTVTKKLRVVCRSCNSGWMGQIEEAAKPILTPLILGQTSVLDVIAQNRIATWAALKVLTLEHNDKEKVIAPDELREKFMTGRVAPQGMKVWIGNCIADGWRSTIFWHVSTISASNTNRPPGPNIQSVTMGAGQLLIHVLHCTAADLEFDLQGAPEGFLFQVFPIKVPLLRWPPPMLLGTKEAAHLAKTLDRLSDAPNVTWIP